MIARLLTRLAAPLLLATAPLAAQEANVETMARLLAAEDARSFDEPLLRAALADPDSSIRSLAALSAGRLRDPRGVPLLVPLLRDRDSLTQAATLFALGLIGDTSAARPIVARVTDGTWVSAPAALEMVTAMAKIGGTDAGSFMRSVLAGSVLGVDRPDRPVIVARAAQEAFRLGKIAPVNEILGLLNDPMMDTRAAAVFTIGRLRIPAAAPRLLEALRDRESSVRANAARALTKGYIDSTTIAAEAVADQLARASEDATPGVRINALRSLGTFKQARLSRRVLPALDDPFSNVQVQAAQTLGELGGPEAVAELTRVATGTKGSFARRRESLLALAVADSAAFVAAAGKWAAAIDWRERAAAATGSARWGASLVEPFVQDRDPRVVAAALSAWNGQAKTLDSALVSHGRKLLSSPDAAVRSVAAEVVGRAASAADVPALVASYQRSARDSFPDAALAVLNALQAIGEGSAEARATVDRTALAGIPQPTNYLILDWADQNWPAASRSWGPPYPIRTGRTMEDYREIARRFLVSSSPGRYPVVKMDVDQLGMVELELFGPDAPLTVANFLMLANRRYFDGMRFHRVVPNFVVQAGDPRGDGYGGPGTTIRDEINRRRYGTFYVGMALSGPDTGGSQWFITLSPQPHLDGSYTVFGRVSSGEPVLLRITQGDLIRTIRP